MFTSYPVIDWKRANVDQKYQFKILSDLLLSSGFNASSKLKSACFKLNILGNNYQLILNYNVSFIQFIKKISFDMVKYAFHMKPDVLEYVTLTDDQYIELLRKNPQSFFRIKNPSHKVCKFAVSIDGMNIQYIQKQTHELQLRAIRQNVDAIEFCIKPNRKLKWIAITKNPKLITVIDHRSQTMVLAAVQDYNRKSPKSNFIDSIPDKFTVAKEYIKLLTT